MYTKTIYSPKLADIAADLAGEGKTNKEIAAGLKIDIKTLYKWQVLHPEFKQAIRAGKDKFDSEVVEKAMLEDAQGHNYEEVTRERVTLKDDEGNVYQTPGLVETKRVQKWERNFQAQKFWLMNRAPERWRDKQEVEFTSKDLEDRLARAEKRLAAIRGSNGEQKEVGTTDNS